MGDTPETKPTSEGVSIAKKAILRDLQSDAADIDALRTNAEADELIAYMRSKQPAAPKPDDKKPMLKLNANMGHQAAPLPQPEDPDKIIQKKFNQTLMDKMDPVSPTQPMGRYNNASRIALIWDDPDHPNGRVF